MAKLIEYVEALQGLLPSGVAWSKEEGATATSFITGIAKEFFNIDQRAADLLREGDPRQALELLKDWERITGLPDACIGELDYISDRRRAVVMRLTQLGGQSRSFFIALAAVLGFQITITEFRPFRAGSARAGDQLTNGPWVHTWRVNAPSSTVRRFSAGTGRAGDSLATWGNLLLECSILRTKPAHTQVLFAYETK